MSAPRETMINLRAPRPQRDLIDRAAQSQGKSRTEFMLEAACEKAHAVLLDQTTFALDKAKFDRFIKLLDRPVHSNAGLERLLAVRAPWDQG